MGQSVIQLGAHVGFKTPVICTEDEDLRERVADIAGHDCLVQVKIALGAPRWLGFAISVWTISVQIVQIHIAISVVWDVGRLARCIRVD